MHFRSQAIHQFQKEYDPKTFVHFMPLHEHSVKKGRIVINRYWWAKGKAQNRTWENSIMPQSLRKPPLSVEKDEDPLEDLGTHRLQAID